MRSRASLLYMVLLVVGDVVLVTAFSTSTVPRRLDAVDDSSRQQQQPLLRPFGSRITGRLQESNVRDGDDSLEQQQQEIWLPQLRRIMAGVAGAGMLETAFLTFEKVTGQVSTLCGVDGNCNSVLTGPYSTVPFTDVPLSAAGFLAYSLVAYLALEPLLASTTTTTSKDADNRVALTTVTTGMATFSMGLMIILFGVLQTTCPYCIFSAACSVILAKLAWIGGCLPKESKNASGAISASFLASTLGAVLLFVNAGDVSLTPSWVSNPTSTTLLAQGGDKQQKLYSPPAIDTDSSLRALQLADSLQALDAKMYGAYWCSHCFDQKELLGKQAFGKITYVECSKDGVNSQTKLCRSKEVPGYPTWEIQGQLYPGQQELDELEDLVKAIQSGSSSNAVPVTSS